MSGEGADSGADPARTDGTRAVKDTPRSGAAGRIVLCYALCGPPIGGFVALAWSGMMASGHYPPSVPLLGFLSVLLFAIPFSYVFGFLPALATGLLAAGVDRVSASWGRNPFVTGLIGAATNVIMNLAVFKFHGSGLASSADLAPYFWSLTGFVSALCCSVISQYFERRADLSNHPDGAGEGSTS
jgi:hypothetical protein